MRLQLWVQEQSLSGGIWDLSDLEATLGDRNNCTRSQGIKVSDWTLSPASRVTLGKRPALSEPPVKQGGWTSQPLRPFQH